MDTKVYFLKEILSNPVIIKGARVGFENVGGNQGVIVLDSATDSDKEFIAGLNDFAGRGVGGVVKINEVQYTQKKSSSELKPSARPKEMLRPRQTASPFLPVQPPAEAMAPKTAAPVNPSPAAELLLDTTNQGPIELPPIGDEPFRPATRRISRKEALAKDA